MIEQLTEREQELTSQLQLAESQLANITAELDTAQQELQELRGRQDAARSWETIAAELEKLRSVKALAPENLLTGGAHQDDQAASMVPVIQRIRDRLEDYRLTREESEKQHLQIRQRAQSVEQQIETLNQQLSKARPAVRTRTFTLTDDAGHTTTIAISYRADAVMPWISDGPDEERFRRIRNSIFSLMLLICLIIPWVQVPEKKRESVLQVSPRMAQLIQKREKLPPPPPPQAKTPAVADKSKLAEAKTKTPRLPPQSQTTASAATAAAREVASRAGLFAVNNTFSDLMDSGAEAKLGKNASVGNGGNNPLVNGSGGSVRTERSLITSSLRTGSGGINTAALSRDVGGVGLGSGGGGSGVGKLKSGGIRVTGIIGGEKFANADRPLSDSYKGSRTDEEIQLVFDRNKSVLYSIYQRELRKDPALEGKIVLRLTIDPAGRVTDCRVDSSDMSNPELEKKIAARVKLFSFGAKDVDTITIAYPIDFLPA